MLAIGRLGACTSLGLVSTLMHVYYSSKLIEVHMYCSMQPLKKNIFQYYTSLQLMVVHAHQSLLELLLHGIFAVTADDTARIVFCLLMAGVTI